MILLALVAAFAARGAATSDPAEADLAAADAVSRASARAVAIARRSVVTIRALGVKSDGYGAGMIVREDGLVLTAFHVVDGATALVLETDDGAEHPAEVVCHDPATDLALLRMLAERHGLPTVRFGRDDLLEVGESVLVVSNPFGVGTTASRGVVSARDRWGVVPGVDVPLIQTDAAINPGSSGGALINRRGEVIGLVTAILTRTGGHQGIGFAIPATHLRRVLGYLKDGKRPPRPWLGVRVAPAPAGLKIKELAPGGPASEAGFRPLDVLESLAGRPLTTTDDLRTVLRGAEVGDELEARVRRAGEWLTLRVRIGARQP
jgi:S1-C subfamily serine protease